MIVLDNSSVPVGKQFQPVGKQFQQAREQWRQADIALFFLPSYSPALSGIEPLWRDVKQYRMRRLSRDTLLALKRDVAAALAAKASDLLSANSLPGNA